MKLDYKNILKLLAERVKEKKKVEPSPFSAPDLAKELRARKDRNKQILDELRNQ